MADTSIVNILIDYVNAALSDVLQATIDTEDPTRAGLVRPGLLQDDPLKYRISILTVADDSDRPNTWHHSIANNGPGNVGEMPSYETGSPSGLWFRRFTTKVQMYWSPSMNRQDARANANIVLSRAEHTISTTQPLNLEDTFGEAALQIFLNSTSIADAGGPGQFIHHAKIWWECLTVRN